MKKILASFVLVLLLASCSLDDNSSNFHFEILAVDSVDIPTNFTLGDTYPIKMYYTKPSTCHYYNSIYYDKDLNIRTVAIESIVEERNNCQDLTDNVQECSFNFNVTSNGTYIFKFWKGKDESGNDIFLEYEIPVN